MSDAYGRFPVLFSPGRIGGLATRNRTVVAPMTRTSATLDGCATAQMVDYYRAYAEGGWGLVITEGTYIDRRWSQGYHNQPGIAVEAQQESWRPVVAAVHAAGAPIVMQLFHAGAVNQGNFWTQGSIAPSAVRPRGEQAARYGGSGPFQTPREITRRDMAEVVEAFAEAARRAVNAGFDGVEVHGANGYLLDQFLTTYTNLRDDEYGGRIENRVRFHLEVMRAVRAAVPGKVVGVRISQSKTNDLDYAWPGGADDARVIFGTLAATGIDYIHVSAHLGVAPVFGGNRSLAGLAKEHGGVAVVANGKLQDAAFAEQALASGEGDFAAIAKGALADQAWPAKVAHGAAPQPFDPAMVTPLATLDNYAAWRSRAA
ncbi:MAG: NADH:flavin oxidoreductase [Alphaproteobacteria bacterium]|nr:NADH:flavin oxidoreductase [Alphaproteobacteria bacterium]